jgi:hypothetical protein
MCLQISDHPAAAVEEHQHGTGVLDDGTVVPNRDGSGRAGNGEVAHLPDRGAERKQRRLLADVGATRFDVVALGDLALPHELHSAQQQLGRRVKDVAVDDHLATGHRSSNYQGNMRCRGGADTQGEVA